MQSLLKSGTTSLTVILPGCCTVSVNSKFPAGAERVMDSWWITTGFYLWDQKRPPSSFLHSVWDGFYHTISQLSPYTDGVLFLCIKPKIAASSEDLMAQLSGFMLPQSCTLLEQDRRANSDRVWIYLRREEKL